MKNCSKKIRINMFQMDLCRLFGHIYRVVTLSKLYLIVTGIMIPSVKLIGQTPIIKSRF